jgi:adenylylsulfate kinase
MIYILWCSCCPSKRLRNICVPWKDLDRLIPRKEVDAKCGWTLWFTGLPCSGKTSLVEGIWAELHGISIEAQVLDGDVLRSTLCRDLSFTKSDRDENVARIGWLCRLLNQHRVNTLAAVVSPYRDARNRLRSGNPRLFEIYVKAPLSLCVQRDVKGLYAKALAGEIRHFTGIDDPYEEPLSPDLVVDTSSVSLNQSVRSLVKWMLQNELLDTQASRSDRMTVANGASR